jgi:hypothetical protein
VPVGHHLHFASAFVFLHAASVCSEEIRQAAIFASWVSEQFDNDAGGAVVGAFVGVSVTLVGVAAVGARVGVAVVGVAVVGVAVVGVVVVGGSVGVAGATPSLHVNGAVVAPRPLPLCCTRRAPAALRVRPQAATTVSAVVKAVPAIPLSASKVNTCSAHRETYSVKTAQGRSALRTTLPFALAIVGFLIVWASFVSRKASV